MPILVATSKAPATPAVLLTTKRPAAVTLSAATAAKITYTDTKLKNGLRVIISEDHSAPVYSIAVTYNAGSRDERKGRTGFAHLFEHLMFKGSENVADGELASLIENYGGSHNGQTDKDHTIYFEQVPSNQLDMVLFLEADRMRSPAITQENVDNQREAVKEERRLRVDNQPYGRTSETIAELAQCPAEIFDLTRTVDVGMAGKDLLDQGRSRTRHADDEHRPFVVDSRIFALRERFLGESFPDRIEKAERVGFLIVELRPLHPAAHDVVLQRLFVLATIIERLGIGEMKREEMLRLHVRRGIEDGIHPIEQLFTDVLREVDQVVRRGCRGR